MYKTILCNQTFEIRSELTLNDKETETKSAWIYLKKWNEQMMHWMDLNSLQEPSMQINTWAYKMLEVTLDTT